MTMHNFRYFCSLYPIGHFMGICQSVMVVENHNCGHHGGSHYEHDAVEVGSCKYISRIKSNDSRNLLNSAQG